MKRLVSAALLSGFSFCATAEIVANPTYTVCRSPGDCYTGSTAAAACNHTESFTFQHTINSSCYPGTYDTEIEYTLNSSAQCRSRIIEHATCESPSYTSDWTLLGTSVNCPADFTLEGGICVADGDYLDEEDALGLADEPEDDCHVPG